MSDFTAAPASTTPLPGVQPLPPEFYALLRAEARGAAIIAERRYGADSFHAIAMRALEGYYARKAAVQP